MTWSRIKIPNTMRIDSCPSIARTIFAIAIGWYIVILIKAKYKRGYIACVSLILVHRRLHL